MNGHWCLNRDAYGFAVRPQHVQRYREYANIYKVLLSLYFPLSSSTFMFLLFFFFQPCKCLIEKVKNKFEAFLAIVFACFWSYNEIIVVTNFKS